MLIVRHEESDRAHRSSKSFMKNPCKVIGLPSLHPAANSCHTLKRICLAQRLSSSFSTAATTGEAMSAKNKSNADGPFSHLPTLLSNAGIKLKASEDAAPAVRQKPAVPASVGRDAASRQKTDDELFLAAMNGIERSRWPHEPHASAEPDPTPPSDPDPEGRRLMQAAIENEDPLPVRDHPEYIEGWIGTAGKKFLPNLRNGLYSIQGQIDLHGFNRVEAQIAVEDYIIRMSRFRACCIKIIHGRGINSSTNRALLKEGLQRFLATRKMSRYVVAYASAQSRDGGVGAVYVLLKGR
jgi:DNA-nicking Smr family endonuclease